MPDSIARSTTSMSPARPSSSVGVLPAALQSVPRARIFHVAEGEARPAEQEHLHEPVKRDRDLAEEKGAEELRRDQDVVDDEERERQRRRGAEDVEEIRQRGEAPLRAVELEEPVDAGREDEEGRQEQGQEMQLRVELRALEAHREGGDHGHRRRHDVMRDDERLLEVLPIHQRAGAAAERAVSAPPPPLSTRPRRPLPTAFASRASGPFALLPPCGGGDGGASAPTGQGGRPFHAGGAMPPSPTLPRNGGEGLSPCRCSSCKAAPGTGAPVRGEGLSQGRA